MTTVTPGKASVHGHLPWVYDYRENITTQHGEDGVITKIFDTIGVAN